MERVVNRLICISKSRGGIVRAKGFTLIEGMVVVTILAIVAALAAPSFVSFIGTMNTKSAAFDLIGDLTMARSEALKRNATITVLPVSNSWSNGWQIRTGAEVLRQREALGSNVSINAPGGGVAFLPNGRLQGDETATANATWSVTSSISGVIARCIVIAPTGSARSRPGACA